MTTTRHKFVSWTLFGLCLLAFACFFIWPVILTTREGFFETLPDQTREFTFQYVGDVFADPVLRESLINSLLIATAVTTLCLLLSMPLAILGTRYEFAGKRLLTSLLLVPLILPPFVGAIGLRHLLGRFGAINQLLIEIGFVDAASPIDFLGQAKFWGVVVMEALHLYPIIYLNVTAALANLDPAMEQAAENLGASPWTRFRRIVFPLILPGVFAGSTIVFIWSFTELGTPLMFDYYRAAPVQVFWGVLEMERSARPYALVAVTLAVSGGLYALARVAFGGRGHVMTTRAMTGEMSRKLRFGSGLLAAAPFVLIVGLAILPHIGVILTSLSDPGSWYRSMVPREWTSEHFTGMLSHPLASGSIQNSLLYASLATLAALVLGFTIAHLTVRSKIFGRQILDALAMLPLAVPGLVLAFGYVAMTLHWPFPQIVEFCEARGWTTLASLHQVLGESPNPILFLVIAYAVRRLPYVVRSATAGMEQISVELEEAAANLGARSMQIIRRVVVPLIIPNLIAGGLLAFSFAMLEVSDSLILAQTEEHFPMTKAIYTLFARLGDGPYLASAMGVWGMALLTVTLIGASLMLGKRLGAIFRI